MKLQDLTASDFTGVDPVKFEEWKMLALTLNRIPMVGLGILVAAFAISVPLIGGAIGWGLPPLAYFAYLISQVPKRSRCAKLFKDLDLGERLKAKLKERR